MKIFRKSVFFKLIGSFILFSIAIVLTFTLCMILETAFIGGGNPAGWIPSSVIGEDGSVDNIELVEKLGGWVEELDENRAVTRVYGDKKTPPMSYSEDELLRFTALDNGSEYAAFYVAPENSVRRFLCVYDRDSVQVNLTLLINNISDRGVPGFLLMFFPLCSVEIVLISLYHKRTIKKPLDKIISSMELLKSGDYTARINIRTEAEFEEIVDAFNVMANRLETEKNEKERLYANKNRMLLELSHDIRTPIATIKSCANALEAGLVPDERVRGYYRTIDAKADRVSALSDDMFTMLKMDDPNYALSLARVNMCEYLRRLCAEFYDEVSVKFDFTVDIPADGIYAEIDAGLFSRVVGNLLSNAVKYNDSGKTVAVRLYAAERVTIEVADDGSPIDCAFAKDMFNAFSRGDKARRTGGGTGLGLAISKLIVEKHGGEIGYFRENGKNVFRVELQVG